MLTETIKAHSGAVWSMQVSPDHNALVTGSADRDVKFWEFEFKDAPAVSAIDSAATWLSRVLDSVWKDTLPSSCEDFEDVR